MEHVSVFSLCIRNDYMVAVEVGNIILSCFRIEWIHACRVSKSKKHLEIFWTRQTQFQEIFYIFSRKSPPYSIGKNVGTWSQIKIYSRFKYVGTGQQNKFNLNSIDKWFFIFKKDLRKQLRNKILNN